jgi:hypothetical protein
MNPLRTRALTRQQIGQFVTSERGLRAFEDAQGDISEQYNALAGASFLTLGSEPLLGSERVLTPVSGELTGADAGANAAYTLGLADTIVVPGTYGNFTGLVRIVVDQKGRMTSATSYALGAGLEFVSDTVQAKAAGAYDAPTGTLARTTFSAGIATGASAAYVQAEANAMLARIAGLEQRLAALITDMKANGNLS